MTEIDTTALRAAAEKATQGTWHKQIEPACDDSVTIVAGYFWRPVHIPYGDTLNGTVRPVADADYIIAAQPSVIIALLDRLANARREGAREMRKRVAWMAANACLEPPDGGSPSSTDVALCDEAARRIRALPDLPDV